MFKKGTKAYSIVNNKCPQCHEGSFHLSHAYNFKVFGIKHDVCPVCTFKFEKEPGFFYGTLYITYAIGVAVFVAWWIVKTVLFPAMSADVMVLWMIAIQVVISPMNLYYAKLLWLNLFVSYNPNND